MPFLSLSKHARIVTSIRTLRTHTLSLQRQHPSSPQLSTLLASIRHLKNEALQYPRFLRSFTKTEPTFHIFRNKYKDDSLAATYNWSKEHFENINRELSECESMRVYSARYIERMGRRIERLLGVVEGRFGVLRGMLEGGEETEGGVGVKKEEEEEEGGDSSDDDDDDDDGEEQEDDDENDDEDDDEDNESDENEVVVKKEEQEEVFVKQEEQED